MPNLGGTPQRKKIDFGGVKNTGDATEEEKTKGPAPSPARRAPTRPAPAKPVHTSTLLDDDDDDEEEEDEIIQASLQSSKDKKVDPKIFGLIAVIAIVVVVALFLLLGGRQEEPPPVTTPPVEDPEPAEPPKTYGDDNIGIQDFTQHTTMENTSPLTDPNGFVEDLYGLTTRVDYHVSAIQSNVVDFVNYTKYRGTWGGGLELYWLDCEYKGAKYVIQVPFQYYKELDDTGIVPVRMEVLYVEESNGDTLTIISYMCLDAATLQTVLKSK